MAITISGENNNDRILAQDGVIDEISGINIVGLLTAGHINVGSNIQLGNAGIITATTFNGNLTGNVNSTSPLLLQTGGSERFRITGNNELGIAGANYGSSGQVLTSGGSGSAVSWVTPAVTAFTNGSNNRVVTATSGSGLNGEANLTFDGTTLNCVAGVGPQIRFENQHGVTTDAAISTFDDAAGTLLCLGSNYYINSSGAETRYNTSEESSAIIINRNGYINFFTGSTGATGVLRFGIASDGKVLIDNSTGTLTIGGDNVYDSAKINLMVGSMSQTSATTEATAIVIHDQNSRRNGTEGTGSWKSKIVFRSTQINGNSASEGASIVHDITYNNYSSTKMRSDLVFKTRGDAQTASSDAATEKLRILHDGKIGIGIASPTFAAGGGVHLKGGNEFTSYRVSAHTNTGVDFSQDATGNGYVYNRDSADLILGTNNNPRLRITSTGEVNIGGDYTQTAYNLSVTNTGGNLFRIKTANEGDYDLRFMVQNSESNIWHYGTDDFVFGNRYDRKLHFITNGSKRLTIHGSYVGINQTAPQTGLHINQDWVNSYGSISAEGSANALVGLGLRSNGNYRGSLIWRDGSSGNYLDISTYGGAYPILFRPNGSEKVRINSNGDLALLKIADNNTSSAGNHGFRFGSWGIQMRDTGGFNHWYIRRNYGGWQTSPQVTFKGSGYTGINRLDPTHYLDVDGTSIFRDRIFSGTMSMKSIPFGANVTYDTGISINGYGYGGSILAICSRNYGSGTNTQSGLYLLKFHYDGNNTPQVIHIAGSNFATFDKSGSNTLTVHMGASNNNITMIESSVVNP